MRFESELKLAREIAQDAGRLLQNIEPVGVLSQKGRDIKLRADLEAENLILERLRQTQIPILSEEKGETCHYDGGIRWIVDPLDGSFNYFKGLQELCCVSIALWDGNKPVLGVVYRFFSEETLTGLVGVGAWRNGVPVSPSDVSAMSSACCATGLSVKGDFSRSALERHLSLFQYAKKVRMLGAAAIMSSSVACGRIDLYHERDILLWDVAAGLAISQAAGASIEFLAKADFKCDASCFATEALRQDFHKLCD